MRRRNFIGGIAGALALPSIALGQQSRMPTLGLLYPNPSAGPQGTALEFFSARLVQLGWKVGQNLKVENASGEGREERMAPLAAALVEKKVDVIWAAGPEAALAAARATRTIPIAFYGVGYPVEQGLVDSLAKPGRNVTGLASFAGSERAKGVELLREAAPKPTRLAWIGVETVTRTLAGAEIRIGGQELTDVANRLGFEFRRHPVSAKEDFDAAFANILESRAQALGADFTALTVRERQRIVNFANTHRLPSVFGSNEFSEAGGLLSYGANRVGMQLQSFTFVDRILRGARPADLPVELPSKFELIANAKTAKALGLSLPQSLILRADRVIE
jgi:putative ABC transport system substrate-binding protein